MQNSFLNKIFFSFVVFSTIFCFQLKAEKNKALIDSLEKISLIQKDTALVKTYNELTWQYRFVNADKAIEYGNKAIDLGIKTSFDKGVAQAYNDLGILYYDKQDNTKALELYNKSMQIRLRTGDKKGVAALYNKMGVMFQKKGVFAKAIEYQQKALQLYEDIKYDFGISYSLNNIAILNYDIGNNEEALMYNLKSSEIKEKIGDKLGLSGSYVNIANIYFSKRDFNKAIDYNLKSLEICRKLGDKEYLSATLNNLSSAYIKQNDFKKAIIYVEESYQLRKDINDKKAMISCLVNMAHIYLKLNKVDVAFSKTNEALELSKQAYALPEMTSIYGAYTEYYETKGDFKTALNYQKLQFAYRDSVLNEDLNSKITEANTKYETEKKEREIAQNKLELNAKEIELNHQRTRNKILIVLFISFIIISLFIYNRYQLKQKIVFNQEMLKQQELRTKAVLEAEEHERMRIARELHDGIGQQLSVAKLNLSTLQLNLKISNDNDTQLIRNAIDMVDDSVKEVRSVSHNMMPNALLKSGLGTAVREFLNRISNTDKVKINLEVHGLNERLEITTETVLFRVLQEIVNNIIKHSQATLVDIQLIRHDKEITLMVEDNGIGFDTTKIENEGIGLKNIQSRIEFLKGTVHFDSQPKRGTTISIEVPIS